MGTQASAGKRSSAKSSKGVGVPNETGTSKVGQDGQPSSDGASAPATGDDNSGAPASKDKKTRPKSETLYYRVTCKDNGVGMPHDKASIDMMKRFMEESTQADGAYISSVLTRRHW